MQAVATLLRSFQFLRLDRSNLGERLSTKIQHVSIIESDVEVPPEFNHRQRTGH